MLDSILPGVTKRKRPPAWPPDTYALGASVLQRTGAYVSVVQKKLKPNWVRSIRSAGRIWRKNFTKGKKLPPLVLTSWQRIVRARNLPLDRIRDDGSLCCALLELVCASDEACAGIGIINEGAEKGDTFEVEWSRVLFFNKGATLCEEVGADRVVVLPKLHTPRSGITLRSLTHNLALYQPGEVTARWHLLPRFEKHHDLKLLLLPWPMRITTTCFKPSKGTQIAMPPEFGFFTCDARRSGEGIMERAKKVTDEARRLAGRVDAIIFPEGSLIGDEYIEISKKTETLVIGGVAHAASNRKAGTNEAALAMPAATGHFTWKQSKHHRWRLDRSQIEQYGLSRILDVDRQWWEDIEIDRRALNFLSLNSWLTLTVLICEDLARMDPITELVRSVGPNLVVSLLLDGPQLAVRWPARYATVLADDPGSSVLTLTSAGMVALSRKRPVKKNAVKRSKARDGARVVALWKDAQHPPIEITLEPGSSGVLLELQRQFYKEWSADGRDDGGTTAYLICNTIRQVRVK